MVSELGRLGIFWEAEMESAVLGEVVAVDGARIRP
jgi:hypothetical protein